MSGKKKKTGQLQTVLVSRKLPVVKAFGLSGAKQIAKGMGLKTSKVDKTENYFRFRQKPPGKFTKTGFRTFSPRPGVQFVFGKPK